MENPYIMSVRLMPGTKEQLEAEAADMGLGVSTYVRLLIIQHLAEKKNPSTNPAWTNRRRTLPADFEKDEI